jgi:hypothetical protein
MGVVKKDRRSICGGDEMEENCKSLRENEKDLRWMAVVSYYANGLGCDRIISSCNYNSRYIIHLVIVEIAEVSTYKDTR